MNRLAAHCAVAIALGVAFAPAFAATKAKQSQAQIDYQQERARCMRGESGQDRATCLKEAGAAYQEARRDALGEARAGELARNATQRCNAQPAADREACVQRIQGGGTTQGSVKGGGVIRRTETPVK